MTTRHLRRRRATWAKLGIFVVCMLLVNAALVAVFTQFGGGDSDFHAIFANVSGLKSGDKVRLAGVPVGTVNKVHLRADHLVDVSFSAQRDNHLTTTTRVAVRYENLVGDRYLELLEGTSPGGPLPSGGTIPKRQTTPALDLDALLGGFRPLFQALEPDQVNRLTSSLLSVFQGQGATVADLLSQMASVTSTIADRDAVIGEVIDNLNTVLHTIVAAGDQFGGLIDSLQHLVSGLSADRSVVGGAVTGINSAASDLSNLLAGTRPDLKGTLTGLDNSLAPMVSHEDELNGILQRMPSNYRQLVRTGAYGSFFNFYLCGLAIKVTGSDGKPITADLIDQHNGRCAWQR